MNIGDISLVVLVSALVALASLFVIFKGFRLPREFHENEEKRAAIRKRLLELESAAKEEAPAVPDPGGDANGKA